MIINYPIDPKTGKPLPNPYPEQQQNPRAINQNPNEPNYKPINPNDKNLNDSNPFPKYSNQQFPNSYNPYINPQTFPYPPNQAQQNSQAPNPYMNPNQNPNINNNYPNAQNPNQPYPYPPLDNNYPPYYPNEQQFPQRYRANPGEKRPRPKSANKPVGVQYYPNIYYGNNSEYPQRPILNFGKPLSIINRKWNNKPKIRRNIPANILYSKGGRGNCFACDVNCGISRSGNSSNNYNPYEASRREIRKDITFYDYERDGYYQYKSMKY